MLVIKNVKNAWLLWHSSIMKIYNGRSRKKYQPCVWRVMNSFSDRKVTVQKKKLYNNQTTDGVGMEGVKNRTWIYMKICGWRWRVLRQDTMWSICSHIIQETSKGSSSALDVYFARVGFDKLQNALHVIMENENLWCKSIVRTECGRLIVDKEKFEMEIKACWMESRNSPNVKNLSYFLVKINILIEFMKFVPCKSKGGFFLFQFWSTVNSIEHLG